MAYIGHGNGQTPTDGDRQMTYSNDIAARFDISATEFARINEVAKNEDEFVAIWENTDWWTDANN